MTDNGDERKLKFPLYNPQNLGAETPEREFLLSLDGWSTEDNDEEVDIVLRVSLNEFVKIATAVDVGRDIAFGEDSDYVWWIWSKSLVSINLCQSIIDCINDPSSGVADAIYNTANEHSYDNQREIGQLATNDNLAVDSNPTCDEDILFGQCLQLVEYLHGLNLDILEVLEVATNPIEFVAQILPSGAEPTTTVIDTILNWASFVQQNIADNYDAQVNQVYLEEVACEIFCIAKDNDCAVDPATLYLVWQERLNATVNISSLINETLLYLISGVWLGREIADFMFFSQLAFRSQLGEWIGRVAYLDLYHRLAVYSNDPNPDWTILCDCVTFVEYDFTVDNQGFVSDRTSNTDLPFSVYVAGQYWEEVAVTNGSSTVFRFASIVSPDELTLPEISHAEIDYQYEQPYNAVDNARFYWNDVTDVIDIATVPTGTGTLTVNGIDDVIENFGFILRGNINTPSVVARIIKIRLYFA